MEAAKAANMPPPGVAGNVYTRDALKAVGLLAVRSGARDFCAEAVLAGMCRDPGRRRRRIAPDIVVVLA